MKLCFISPSRRVLHRARARECKVQTRGFTGKFDPSWRTHTASTWPARPLGLWKKTRIDIQFASGRLLAGQFSEDHDWRLQAPDLIIGWRYSNHKRFDIMKHRVVVTMNDGSKPLVCKSFGFLNALALARKLTSEYQTRALRVDVYDADNIRVWPRPERYDMP